MAQQSSLQVKRRFEVNLPVSHKRHRGNEIQELQQNPLQVWLTRKKTAPGLEALLSEARKETTDLADKGLGKFAQVSGVNEPLAHFGSTPQCSGKPLVRDTVLVSGNPSAESDGKTGGGGKANEGLQRQTVKGLANGEVNGTGSSSEKAGIELQCNVNVAQPNTPRKKKQKGLPVADKAVNRLVSSQPKVLAKVTNLNSPTKVKKIPSLLVNQVGRQLATKEANQGGQLRVKPNPKTPDASKPSKGKLSSSLSSADTNGLPKAPAIMNAAPRAANKGPADVRMTSAPRQAERPLPSGGRGPSQQEAPHNPSRNPGLGHGLAGAGADWGAHERAPFQTGWDLPGPVPGMGFAPTPPTGPWGHPQPSGPFHTGFHAGNPPEAPGVSAFLEQGFGPGAGAGVNGPGRVGNLSLQAQECQRLWEALQRSMQTWQSVLLQQDIEASQRSLQLQQQAAANQRAQETAAEQLAVARKLKNAAEEICHAAVEERRSAAAELKDARDERTAIERAKQELETRREELATEAMELEQKRRLHDEALARLEAERASAEDRHQRSATPSDPSPEGPPPSGEIVIRLGPLAAESPGVDQDDVIGRVADASTSDADVSRPAGVGVPSSRPPFLGVVSSLMGQREGSGSPSPLGLYRGFGGLGSPVVKLEAEEFDPKGGSVNTAPEEGGNAERASEDGFNVWTVERGDEGSEKGVELDIKMEPLRGNASEDMSMSDEDLPLSFRSARRRELTTAERSIDSKFKPVESAESMGDCHGNGIPAAEGSGEQLEGRVGDRQQEAAQLVSEIKAELAGGRHVKSVPRGFGQDPGSEPDSKPESGHPQSPGLGPLGRYPHPLMPHPTAEMSVKAPRGMVGDFRGGGELGAAGKKRRTAVEVLGKDAPELLESLSAAGMLDDMKLYGEELDGDEDAAGSASFRALQAVLNKIYDATPARNGASWTSSGISGAAHLPRYCMGALKVLTDEARRLRRGGRPVEWGWCHKLHAFLFVFEEQNRFVVEWPQYGNATYFFNLEAGDVQFQLQRLIAVMAIGTVTKNDIVEDRPLERIRGIPPDELRVLEEFGRKPETGLGAFLNFANRVVHDYKDECTLEQWQVRIRGELHRGRNTGQIEKSPRPLPWAGLGEIAPLALEGGALVTREELLAVKAEQLEELEAVNKT